MNPLKLFKSEIVDRFIKENFAQLERHLKGDPFGKGEFKFFELTFAAAVTALEIPHRLGFLPKDVIPLSVRASDGSAVTWHFDDFTRTHLVITTTGACTVRAYVGCYREN